MCRRRISYQGEASILLFSKRLALLAALEFTLAAIVICGAFLLVAGAHQITPGTAASALVAHVTFAVSLLLPAGVFGVHRFDRGEALRVFLQKSFLSIGLGLLLCYAAFSLLPSISDYRESIWPAAALGAAGLLVIRILLVPRLRVGQHRVLIVGTARDALLVDDALQRFAGRGVSVVGFYQTVSATPVEVPPERIVKGADSLDSLVRRLSIQAIVVAVREQRGGTVPVDELLKCRLRGVEVTDVPRVLERLTGTVPIETLKSSWLIYGAGFRQDWGRRAVKRTFDVVMATALLVITTPIMLAAALAIFLESGRPVIFRQHRVGLGGRGFSLLKFRSMRTDAERDGVPKWACFGDPRVTGVGRLIRRWRIDELPQLINVLRGDMSFVGPRPERPYFVAELVQQVPFYSARHTVKPGVTGWAQVRYPYGASIVDAVRKLELDLYYVKNHSLLLDLLIIVKTVRVVLSGEGAR